MLLHKDYQTALDVQDACNLCGVAQAFARVMLEILRDSPNMDSANTHPIAVMYASKIASMTGSDDTAIFSDAYDACTDKAKTPPLFDNPYNDGTSRFIDLGRYVHPEKNGSIDTYDLYALIGNPSGTIDLGARYGNEASEHLSGTLEPSGNIYGGLVLQECACRLTAFLEKARG